MISRINLLKRKEGLSAEEFAAYLTQAHAGLLATMPYLKGCETNVVVDNEQRSPFDRGSTEIDGYTEMFFDSYGDMVRGMAALEESLAADYAQFAAPDIPALVAVKKVDTPVPAFLDGVKLIKRMSFLGRKDGVSAAVFQDEWWQMHSALVKTMTGLCRLQSEPRHRPHRGRGVRAVRRASDRGRRGVLVREHEGVRRVLRNSCVQAHGCARS